MAPPVVQTLQPLLAAHPVYGAVADIRGLRCFMEHHVFAVWDFMSLVKALQDEIAPSRAPWVPVADPALRRFIHEIVLDEESDVAPPGSDQEWMSHFELYCLAMEEVGASTAAVRAFVDHVERHGVHSALDHEPIPACARAFVRQTFDTIERGGPLAVAASFAYGREQVIPSMFEALVERCGVGPDRAPAFHHYLHRHIELDGGHHGDLAERLVEHFVDAPHDWRRADREASRAIRARMAFWDGVLSALSKGHGPAESTLAAK